MGLGLKEQKGPRCDPHPWSQRTGDLTWESSRLSGLEWAGQTPSSPLLLLGSGRTPRACLSSSPRSPSYALKDPRAWRGLWRAGDWPGSSEGSPGLSGRGNHPPLFFCSSRRAPPTCSPDLPGLRGMDPVWSPLLFPPQSPYVLPVHSGVPPVSLGVRVPHQRPAGALVVGRL